MSMRTIVLDIHPDGSMHVTIDGNPLPPEDEWPWSRSAFPQIIDQASEDRSRPVRVEVHEADGTSFTDLLPARPPRRTPEPDPAPEPAKPRKHRTGAKLIEVTAEGFIPGEDIICCLIASHTEAAPDAAARALVDLKQVTKALQTGNGEVVLIGRISGHMVVRSLS
ncbi:hypothetical protein BCY76_005385 [Nesterenkonia sp. PF2B19]|nr:hypothetical protein BCY76_005385 [Nesterenkonia sp. PF2B19]